MVRDGTGDPKPRRVIKRDLSKKIINLKDRVTAAGYELHELQLVKK